MSPVSSSVDEVADCYQRRKVIVTGGLGFIGSNLARRLVDLGAEVTVVDALIPNFGGNPANLRGFTDKLRVCHFDLCDSTRLAPLLPGCEFVFNLAGQVSHLDSMLNPLTDLDANVRAQLVLLEACRRHCPEARVVFASTRQIYGRPTYLPVDEHHPLQPVDVNGVHKMAAEAHHILYHQVYGLPTVCLRLTNTFGPRMRIKDARQTFLGIWLRRVVENGVFEVWGGAQKRDLTHVEDVVEAFLLAGVVSGTIGQSFNVGGSLPMTLQELAEQLVDIARTGRYELKEFPQERKRIDIGDYFADDQRFRQLTGWRPKVSVPEGLASTIAYYRSYLSDYV